MSLDKRADEIERVVGELASQVPRELATYLKQQFEKFLPQILGGSAKVEMRVVLDASSAVAEVLAYAKNGDSVLVRLAKEPFLKLYAPPEIIPEVEKSLKEIAAKRKMDYQQLLGIWRVNLLPLLTVQGPVSLGAWFRGLFIMGKRDVKDVPYVALSFDFEMHGVITRDLDILEQPQVHTWKIGKVKQVVTVMKKGSMMFVASSEVLFPLIVAMFQLAVSFLRALYDLAVEVGRAIGEAIRGAVREVKKWPDWAKLALVLASVLALQDERIRSGLQAVANAIGSFLVQLFEAIKAVIQFLAPLIEIPIAAALVLLKDVGEALVELQNLSLTG